MAKKMEIQERFRVHCEVDTAEEMGVLIAQLTRMGVKSIGHELVTDVYAYKAKRVHETPTNEAIAEWLKEHPTFKARELVGHLETEGRNRNSIYGAIKAMVANGELKKLGAGNYSDASVKQIEAPKTRAPRGQFKITGREEVKKFIRSRKSFTVQQLMALFDKQGRVPHSVSPILTGLIAEKMIKHSGEPGNYLVTAQIRKSAVKKAKEEKPKAAKAKLLNGAATGEATHG
jgi:hypothetical protein